MQKELIRKAHARLECYIQVTFLCKACGQPEIGAREEEV